MIVTSRSHLHQVMLAYGEEALAARIPSLSDDDMDGIGRLAMRYIAQHRLIDAQLAAATVEHLEGTARPLARTRRNMAFYTDVTEEDRRASSAEVIARSLRRKRH